MESLELPAEDVAAVVLRAKIKGRCCTSSNGCTVMSNDKGML